MNETENTSAWLEGVDRAVQFLERPNAKWRFCRGTVAAWRMGLIAGTMVASQLIIPLMARFALVPAVSLTLLYGVAAGFLIWTAIRWAEAISPRWLFRYPAGAAINALPGFSGLTLVILFAALLGVAPLLFLLPKAPAVGALWGSIFLAYFCLLGANQRAGQKTLKSLQAAQDQSLRAKLAPHFLFNTLNSLKVQIEKDPTAASRTVDRLASLFRQLVEAADRPRVPIKEELAFVEAYLGIERARMGDRLQVRVDVPEDLEDLEVPPFALQVLVENAVKHGVAPLEAGGLVTVRARKEGAFLVITVQDPGSGPGAGVPGTGTALETLRQRLGRPEDLVMGMVDGRHEASFRVKA